MNEYFFEIENQKFLIWHKALFWENKQALLLADLHLGKEVHFRKSGVPVPDDVKYKTIQKLDKLIKATHPEKIYLLGDLFHHKNKAIVEEFNAFCLQHKAIEFVLIIGNHDRWIASATKFKCVDSLSIDHIFLSHEPTEKEGFHNICGHIHPAVKLSGKGKQKLTLPCLWHQSKQTILPSFGYFTGSFVVQPKQEDTVFVFDENELIMRVL